MSEKTRTRFAPSPTGYMHVGNLRTALYAYLITKKHGGDFILRIEDTDQERYVEGATDIIYSTLVETGLNWDEGPDKGGDFGPYIQSERRELYKQYAEQLCRDGKAYYCFCTKERLEELHEMAGGVAKYDRHCRDIPYEEAKARADAGEPYVIRQKMPIDGATGFDDCVYGAISVENAELEDQILLKSDGLPTYNFANVIDDHLMGITHVVRGSEYLVSTPKYNLLYEAFGWEPPAYIHCPPVMKDAQNKLSKRNGDASYQDLKTKGYLTGAILNYIALLGWSPGGEREKYTLDELVEAFDVKGISKSPAIFDSEKLRWLNAEYIRALSDEEFHEAALPYIKLAVGDYETDTKLIAECLHQRCEVLGEISDQLTFIPKADEYTTEIFVNKKSKSTEETSKVMLEAAIAELEALQDWTKESVHELLIGLAERLEVKNGLLMWPVRVAVSGRTVTPGGAVEVLIMVGKDEALRRLRAGLAKLNGEEVAEAAAAENTTETAASGENDADEEINGEKKISENFITQFIKEDLAEGGRCEGMKVHTRFPPEPNGCLHIGHVKALVIDYGIAEQFGGIYNLRMDDTNPTKEREEFVEAIKDDIHWLGYDWGDRYCFASEYFEQTYEYAIELINKGLAYVCELTPEQMKEMRGTHDTPAVSPYRDRPIEENLDLFKRMRAGEFEDGRYTLRAKIDLASGNWNMRDPVIYRIKHTTHHRTGDEWCIYPMYDFAHPIGDAIEHITHSLCSLEYEDHRPLYDWVINNVSVPSKPRQIEFARLGIDYTVLSKRKLRNLIEQGIVSGWDDPRMPTLIALRRRGYTPAAIKNFCERIGVAKNPNVVQWSFLEHCLRGDLNENAKRAMAVLHPVKLVITNYPEGGSELLTCENHPNTPEDTREISFSRELWIEADDFMEEPVKKYQRLYPGNLVRLKSAYIVKCTGCKKDEDGNVVEVYAEYDPDTKGGNAPEGVKVRGTIHWVDANCSEDAEVRLFDRLFTVPNPDAADVDYMECVNPDSMQVLTGCKVESSLKAATAGEGYQFLRLGYFCADCKDSSPEHLVFNRSVMLKDSFKPGE